MLLSASCIEDLLHFEYKLTRMCFIPLQSVRRSCLAHCPWCPLLLRSLPVAPSVAYTTAYGAFCCFAYSSWYLLFAYNALLHRLRHLPQTVFFRVIVLAGRLAAHVLKTATLCSTPACVSLSPMTFQTTPLVRVAIEPKNPKDAGAVERGLALLNQADPCVELTVSDTGEMQLSTLGELHLDRCLRDLITRFARCEISVSPPIMSFFETITEGAAPVAAPLSTAAAPSAAASGDAASSASSNGASNGHSHNPHANGHTTSGQHHTTNGRHVTWANESPSASALKSSQLQKPTPSSSQSDHHHHHQQQQAAQQQQQQLLLQIGVGAAFYPTLGVAIALTPDRSVSLRIRAVPLPAPVTALLQGSAALIKSAAVEQRRNAASAAAESAGTHSASSFSVSPAPAAAHASSAAPASSSDASAAAASATAAASVTAASPAHVKVLSARAPPSSATVQVEVVSASAPPSSASAFLSRLRSLFSEAKGGDWSAATVDGIWACGPKRCGPNILLCASARGIAVPLAALVVAKLTHKLKLEAAAAAARSSSSATHSGVDDGTGEVEDWGAIEAAAAAIATAAACDRALTSLWGRSSSCGGVNINTATGTGGSGSATTSGITAAEGSSLATTGSSTPSDRTSSTSSLVSSIAADDPSKLKLVASIAAEAADVLTSLLTMLRSSITQGFQLATAAGPMCGEPMWGVAFVIDELVCTPAAELVYSHTASPSSSSVPAPAVEAAPTAPSAASDDAAAVSTTQISLPSSASSTTAAATTDAAAASAAGDASIGAAAGAVGAELLADARGTAASPTVSFAPESTPVSAAAGDSAASETAEAAAAATGAAALSGATVSFGSVPTGQVIALTRDACRLAFTAGKQRLVEAIFK